MYKSEILARGKQTTEADVLIACYERPEVYTLDEAAALLSMGRKTVEELIASGQIQTFTFEQDPDRPIVWAHTRISNWAIATYIMSAETATREERTNRQ